MPATLVRPAARRPASGSPAPEDHLGLHGAARHGVSGSGGRLPHQETIQRAFGRHDLSSVSAHTGGEARDAAQAMGASAYAMGDRVAFDGSPSLHTAAHEAAHVVQQQAGVQLEGGVGRPGDVYERNADAVADAVVAGRSAEPLLDPFAGPGGAGSAIQMKRPTGWSDADETSWLPGFYGGFSYELVNDAFDTLDLDGQRPIANQWAAHALSNGLVGKGSIRSTYKSGYDQDPDAFSVSQNVPMLEPLVVHAHISSEDVVALDGGVNLKWKHDEIGHKAANVPSSVGKDIIDVAAARAHWEANPGHDKAEQDAEDLAVGRAIAALFDEEAHARAAAKEKAEAEATARAAERDLINWGWKNTNDTKRYGKFLKSAQTKAKAGDNSMMDELLAQIRQAQARRAAKAAKA